MDSKKGECKIILVADGICESIDDVCYVIQSNNEDLEYNLYRVTDSIEESTEKMEIAAAQNAEEVRDVVEACTVQIIDAMEENTKKITEAIEALTRAILRSRQH